MRKHPPFLSLGPLLAVGALLIGLPATAATPAAAVTRPNILWFVVEDMSANFSCYGEKTVKTPHVDRLAAEGVRFSRAYVTAPVCSAARSALITGMYQGTIGAHQHRSGRGEARIQLPEGVVPIPRLFQKAGYFTANGSGLMDRDLRGMPFPKQKATEAAKRGKTDYNFDFDSAIYDASDWSSRAPGQPFFMQVQLAGGKLRGASPAANQKMAERAQTELGSATAAESVVLPPYYPRDPVLLQDWAAYLDAVRLTDLHVGRVLERLEREGLLENTLVVFMTDHGISHARGKQFLYDEGTHIPFIVRGPGIERGKVRPDLIEHIDMAATSLAAAGIEIPKTMQARNILAPKYQPRTHVFAARDRCDETTERIRSVRTERFLFIRNFHPQRPHLQPCAYKDGKAIVQTLRRLHDSGALDPLAEKLLFSPTRPPEELYEWTTDKWQLTNLANDPAHKTTLETLRARLDQWMQETKDLGPESEAMYDSDMAVYVGKGNPEVEKNITIMKQWAKQGK